jgi:hypothetical protein
MTQSPKELPENFSESIPEERPLIEYDPDAPQEIQPAMAFAETADTVILGKDYFDAQEELESQLSNIQAFPSSLPEDSQDYIGGREQVLGTGLGFRNIGGYLTPEIGLKVYVTEKTLGASASSLSGIPSQVGDIPVDIEQVGEAISRVYNQRYQRPVNCGVSIGDRMETGTLGCLVELNNGKLCLLSNNHVIANLNNANIGDAIIQAGSRDQGQDPQDRIAILEKFVPINFSGQNTVDAAVAWTRFGSVNPSHVTYTLNPTPVQPSLGMTVVKNGRTTQSTIGTITDININITVSYRTGSAKFSGQIGIRGIGNSVFSKSGDSGSLIVTSNTKQPVALLFAGMNGLTLANPIASVMSALDIRRFINGIPNN